MSHAQATKTGKKIVIDPITRIEGHMRVEAVVDDGVVKDARCCGTLFRGFERILTGRYPVDANRITQRVCGVCPTAHATASTFCLDDALGLTDRIPENGRLVRNLLLGANYLQSHILHFFTLAALDYVDVAALADYDGNEADMQAVKAFIGRGELGPFFPRYEGDYRCTKEENVALVRGYLQALHIRRITHEMAAIFGGKMPHNVGIVPGGVTETVTPDKVSSFAGKLVEVKAFVENVYIPAILTVASRYGDHFDIGAGCMQYMTYGLFNLDSKAVPADEKNRMLPPGVIAHGKLQKLDAAKITEHVKYSRYDDSCAAPPAEGSTWPDPEKAGSYSWIKAPRYDDKPTEVGPVARVLVAYMSGQPTVKKDIDAVLSATGLTVDKLHSILGRHAARALECRWACDAMADWLEELKPGEPAAVPFDIPDEAQGMGLADAPRGAVGHWMTIKDKKIANYQLVVPTTWNGSPRDANDVPGPIEQALIGSPVKDAENPFEVVRTVRSFDPCLACSVHVLTAKGRKVGEYRVV